MSNAEVEEFIEETVEEVENIPMEASSENLPTFHDYESALKYVRDKMAARETNFKILLHYTVSERYAGNLYEDAKKYTESCTGQEGDALRWHSSSGRGVRWYYSKEYDLIDFEIEYNSTAAQEAELTNAVKKAMQEMKLNGKSDYEKIKTIYTYVGNHVNYAYDYLEGKEYSYDVHSAYGALCKGEAVCQGYANLFYRLCKEAGLSVRIVGGTGFSECRDNEGAPHTWNIVKLDGKYYNVDITWDGSGNETYYNYFLKTDADFKKSHLKDLKYCEIEFLKEYPMTSSSYFNEELRGDKPLNLIIKFCLYCNCQSHNAVTLIQ